MEQITNVQFDVDNIKANVTVSPQEKMRITLLEESKEIEGNNDIPGSKKYRTITLLPTSEEKETEEGFEFTTTARKGRREAIMENDLPILFGWLERHEEDLDLGKKLDLPINRVTATVPMYYPRYKDTDGTNKRMVNPVTKKEVILDYIDFYLMPGQSLQSKLRRQMRNLDYVVAQDIDIESLDKKLEAEAKIEEETKASNNKQK